MAEALFYVLAAGTIGFGVGVVRSRLPLFSVLCLLASFACLAAIYLLAGFQFLAATQLLVYAGAVLVLMLFVVMLLNLGDEAELARHTGPALSGRRLAVAAGIAGVLAVLGILTAGFGEAYVASAAAEESGVDALDDVARALFSRYMLPFEAASLLLLATMIAVIALAKRERGDPRGDEGRRFGWPWSKGVQQ